ncbi:MAG: 4-(cytidine 5'-diphospho)-2-C-methyl-D-erythritol kinase [Deltaproteobacteria bacterium]|nr:4-(cytidine 5'-diphospho)-2-C-methyl-D-erythritol kinase [Deltaproteobacteria bacterium]
MEKRKILLHAPAKINLFLHVLGRRSDGYHDIETWMQKIDLFDIITLEITAGSTINFSCSDPEIPAGEGNLAVRAAMVFCSSLGLNEVVGIKISLDKKIPVAAGLGGGSSDAGTVLKGLNELFDQPFTNQELILIGRSLGADVPFFAVEHEAVIARGIGDIMHPVSSLNDCTFVLVNPGFFVSTRWAFENLSLTRAGKKYNLSCFRNHKNDSPSLAEMHNDLEECTCTKYPEVADMKRQLLDLGASGVLMSGSGPTVFGVFPDSGKLANSCFDSIRNRLCRKFGNRVFVTRAVGAGAWPSG